MRLRVLTPAQSKIHTYNLSQPSTHVDSQPQIENTVSDQQLVEFVDVKSRNTEE